MEKKSFFRFSIVFAAIYFASINGLASIPKLAVSFLLKDEIKVSASGLAYFQAIVIAAWVIKPLWGIISDSFLLFGYRRKSYLVLTSAVASATWFFLGCFESYSAQTVLLFLVLVYMAYAFQDVVTDGWMIEVGKPENLTGRFQSIQWGAVYVAMILSAFAGGWLADLARDGRVPYQKIFLGMSVFPAITLLLVLSLAREAKPSFSMGPHPFHEAKSVFLRREIWLLAFFLFFWNFSPSFGAPFFYYCVDQLKFSASFLGLLQAVASASALVGAIVFGRYLGKMNLRKILVSAVFVGIGMIFFHYIYFLPSLVERPDILRKVALVSGVLFGAVESIIFLALLNLAAKVSPISAGATVFALLSSFLNLGTMGSDAVGGLLFSLVGLKPLISLSALFSLCVLFILPYLPLEDNLTVVEKFTRRMADEWVKPLFSLKGKRVDS